MTMRTALRSSSNRAAVHMLDDVGIDSAVSLATRMGLDGVPSVPSLALGAGDVTLMSMTAAYGAFANQGLLPIPTLIRRVETSSGEVLYERKSEPQRVISESTAFLMTSMLADVVNSGTAWPARRVGFTLPAAGKTGTTNDYRDAWFVGFTPAWSPACGSATTSRGRSWPAATPPSSLCRCGDASWRGPRRGTRPTGIRHLPRSRPRRYVP